jgi:hypothetical protein
LVLLLPAVLASTYCGETAKQPTKTLMFYEDDLDAIVLKQRPVGSRSDDSEAITSAQSEIMLGGPAVDQINGYLFYFTRDSTHYTLKRYNYMGSATQTATAVFKDTMQKFSDPASEFGGSATTGATGAQVQLTFDPLAQKLYWYAKRNSLKGALYELDISGWDGSTVYTMSNVRTIISRFEISGELSPVELRVDCNGIIYMLEAGRELTTFNPAYTGTEGDVIFQVGSANTQSTGGSRQTIMPRSWVSGSTCKKTDSCWIKGFWIDTRTAYTSSSAIDIYFTYSVAYSARPTTGSEGTIPAASFDSIWKVKADGTSPSEIYQSVNYEHFQAGQYMGKLWVEPEQGAIYVQNWLQNSGGRTILQLPLTPLVIGGDASAANTPNFYGHGRPGVTYKAQGDLMLGNCQASCMGIFGNTMIAGTCMGGEQLACTPNCAGSCHKQVR